MNNKERSLIAQSFYLKYVEVWGKKILADKALREQLRLSAIHEADMFIRALEATANGK